VSPVFINLGLAAFGLTAMWWAMGHNPRLRRWAPVVGLCGQVFWFSFAWFVHKAGVDVFGLVLLCSAYTAVYLRGAWVQWLPVLRDRLRYGEPSA
jgi:hypothetical protein